MKKVVITLLSGLLLSCGGRYDGLAPRIENGNGEKIGAGSTFRPDKNAENWKYGSVSNENGVFSLSAKIDATNTYIVPKYPNLERRSWIELEKRKTASGGVDKNFTLYAPEELRCTPNCQVKIKFNSSFGTFSFEQRVDGVLTPLNQQISTELFNRTTNANSAVFYLPVVGLSDEVESEFNLRGYDEKKMMFSEDSNIILQPIANVSCDSFETKSEVQAYFDAELEGYESLDGDDDGIPCEDLE